MTSFKSIKTDVANAGAKWEDFEVVVDQGVITSRNPGDLEAFSAKIIEEIKEGRHDPTKRGLTSMKSTKIAGDAGFETRRHFRLRRRGVCRADEIRERR